MSESRVLPPSRIIKGKSRGYIITDDHRYQVTIMAAAGMPENHIALAMDIDVAVLKRRFKRELLRGQAEIVGRLTAVLVQQALNGNVSAIKYYLSNRRPEWRLAREDQMVEPPDQDTVHFYLPPNHRDEPEELPEPPTIEGEAEAA